MVARSPDRAAISEDVRAQDYTDQWWIENCSGSSGGPVITVFTPTFNRRDGLRRVYGCLRNQTWQRFEWLIVDDGSTDGTAEDVEGWRSEAPFPIRYRYQENSGKAAAYNVALELAGGDFFLVIDSGDCCVPTALERLLFHWCHIPQPAQESYSGVAVLCQDTRGRVVGRPYPVAPCDEYPVRMLARGLLRGEKWGVHRTEVLRQYPFPQFTGETLVAEGLVWNRVGSRYRQRYVNEALRIYEPSAGGVTDRLRRLQAASPRSSALYYAEYLRLPVPTLRKFLAAVNLVRFSLHAGEAPLGAVPGRRLRLLTAVASPAGFLLFALDQVLLRAGRPGGPS